MGNLAGNNIGLNYKGLLNLENLNTNMAARQTITDGENVNSCLRLGVVDAVFTGNVGFGSDITPTAFIHARAINTYDYLFKATNMSNADILTVRSDIPTSESVLSKYGFMCENSGSFQIAGFGATFGGDRMHLYSGAFMRVSDPASGIVVGIGGNPGVFSPDPSALLDLQSTNKGFLKPRMTAGEASAIAAVDGLELYVTDTNEIFTDVGFWGYENGAWTKK